MDTSATGESGENEKGFVLIVEDSRTQALQLKHILTRNGYETEVAEDGVIALERLQARRPLMIISDIVMPKMDGYELCKAVKADRALKDVPVILLTTLSDPQDVIRGLQSGADNFITKPYKEDFLLSRLHYIILNHRLRQGTNTQMGIELFFGGEKYFITSDRVQIIDLMFSSFESAVQQKMEYERANEELKIAQAELVKAKTIAEKADEAKSTFLANMSHELRTPLNSIIGFANVLQKNSKGGIGERERTFVEKIANNGTHLLALINDILDLSKIEAGRMEMVVEPTNVGELIAAVIADFGGDNFEADVSLATTVPEDMVPVDADPKHLRQVLTNLVSNAVKFTDQGEVRVEVTCETTGRRRRPVQIDVVDSGIGIPASRLDAIFDPFRQVDESTSRKYGGTGLGLSISRSLCHNMGFELRAASEEGKGSTFTVDLRPAKDD